MAKPAQDKIKTAFNDARQLRMRGRLREALRAFDLLTKNHPGLAEVHFNIAEIQMLLGNKPEAARAFEAALALRPSEPAIWLGYMEIVLDHPEIGAVETVVARSAQALGTHPAVDYFKGRLALRKDDLAGVTMITGAQSKGVTAERGYLEVALAQAQAGQSDAALASFASGLRAHPKSTVLLSQKADLLRDTGQFDAAAETALRAIEVQPSNGHLYHGYVSIRKVAENDPQIGRMQRLFDSKTAKAPDRRYLAFALAKAMEDTGHHDRVFRYLDIGNKDFARDFPYGFEADKRDLAEIRALYEDLEDVDAEGPDSPAPIFVTGMPRSGTTLVEQIIAAHSTIRAGGEIGLFGPALSAFRDRLGKAEKSEKIVAETCRDAAQSYGAALERRFPGAGRLTDKSISSFASIGLIRRILPQARIVVVRRDPRDNALSIYKNVFRPGTHRYSTDLRNIARFYRLFESQLAYWQTKCPDSFHVIDYETLIDDPEGETRRLIAKVGLDWEEGCLSFHKNRNRVQTLSSVQVRQPIYASSVQGWHRYERELAPFLETYEATLL